MANFFSTLLLALHERKAEFPTPTAAGGNSAINVGTAIRRCLQEYINQWNKLSSADVVMVQHITEVGMYVGEVKMVSEFLATIPPLMDHPSEALSWYNDAVIPLMAKLRELMKKLEEEIIGEDGEKTLVQPKITQEPFRSFFKPTICVYLAYILGGKENVPSIPPIVAGCGCADCDELDEFIRGPEASCRFEAYLGEDRLEHVLGRVTNTNANEIIDAFDDKSTPEPYSMILTKKREVVKTYTWAGRQEQAVKFMQHAVHGGEMEMRRLLGKRRYEDVLRAIHGVKAFELSDEGADGVGEEGDDSESESDGEDEESESGGGELGGGEGADATENGDHGAGVEDRMVVDESKVEEVNGGSVEGTPSAKRKREE